MVLNFDNIITKGEKSMKKKGFTLIELLVVIAIIAMLMAILMPALSTVRKMAYKALCGTNLSGIYKALGTYAQQYKDDYPKSGGRAMVPTDQTSNWADYSYFFQGAASTFWGATFDWAGYSESYAFKGTTNIRKATIGSCFFLLIKYADLGPKVFICKADSSSTAFKLADYANPPTDPTNYGYLNNDIKNAWDFGTMGTVNTKGIPPAQHYSYCYQMPFGGAATAYFQANPSRQPDFAMMADRSPYMVVNPDTTAGLYRYTSGANEDTENWGNSDTHGREGQNVLYNNGAVAFSKVPYSGINNDNIYTRDTTVGFPQAGTLPSKRCYNMEQESVPSGMLPQNGNDSFLVNEGLNQGGTQQ
jgi:prepilin-type N-terminal cleavage/methylation domain-containing protein